MENTFCSPTDAFSTSAPFSVKVRLYVSFPELYTLKPNDAGICHSDHPGPEPSKITPSISDTSIQSVPLSAQ